MAGSVRLDNRIDNLSRRVTKVDHRIGEKIDNLAADVNILIGKVDILTEMMSKVIIALGQGNHSISLDDPAATVKRH